MPSKSILIAWELGGGLGHLIPMLPLVQRFFEAGHRISVVARDLSRLRRLFDGLSVALFQAPIKTTRPQAHVDLPRTFAHILHNSGYADCHELQGLAEAWRNLYDLIRPDIILCDHSPTALVAARGTGIAVATTGTGFCCPPDITPLPDFRPWLPDASQQLGADEALIVQNINVVLAAWKTTPLENMAQLYSQVDECFLATFRELDHYPTRGRAAYWGAWPNVGGEAPRWPQHDGRKRAFAYLKKFRALPDLLRRLSELRVPTIVYCEQLPPGMGRQFASEWLHFADSRVDLAEVGRQCDLAILNGGHGATVSFLLSGKPILQIPLNLEQTLTGLATARLHAGLSAEPTKPQDICHKLTRILNNECPLEGAVNFARRYARFNAQQQLDRFAARIYQLAGLPARKTSTDSSSPMLILGVGTGRCGTTSLAALLNAQVSTAVLHELRPPLPWSKRQAPQHVVQRLERLLAQHPSVERVGDVAHYYLPYMEDILRNFERLRVICLQRGRRETVDSFLQWIFQTRRGMPVNHWAADRSGLVADAWDDCFPKYDTTNMADAIGRFWDEYYDTSRGLATSFPEQFRIFSTASALNDQDGIATLLDWIGIPRSQQTVCLVHANASQAFLAR